MKINPLRRALLAILLFTILFALLMVAAAYLWTHDGQRMAMVCFIAAFIAMLCQIGSFMLFVRHKQWHAMARKQKENQDAQSQ